MDTNDVSSVLVGQVAIVTGIAGLLGLVFIILFFSGIALFGTLNDIFIGVTALLSVVLAWLLLSRLTLQPRFLALGLVLVATLGALVVVLGSVLVISKTTGWFLAGLYMAAGNALIGLWLIGFSLSARGGTLLPQNLVTFGLINWRDSGLWTGSLSRDSPATGFCRLQHVRSKCHLGIGHPGLAGALPDLVPAGRTLSIREVSTLFAPVSFPCSRRSPFLFAPATVAPRMGRSPDRARRSPDCGPPTAQSP